MRALHSGRESRPAPADLPPVSPRLLGWFARYTRWYLRRHFHAVRLASPDGLPDTRDGVPLVVFLNHASWWDPLVCLHLSRTLFPEIAAFAPIDAPAIAKYPFFGRLGFFGVEPGTARGAATFLHAASRILARPSTSLWITPQARFADVRERPAGFRHGLGHLASRAARSSSGSPGHLRFLPLAIEYTWWQERQPEVLLRFGQPLEVSPGSGPELEPADWSLELERRLEAAQDALAAEARRRDPTRFSNLLSGTAGIGGVYDFWRRLRALGQGRRFDPRHGTL